MSEQNPKEKHLFNLNRRDARKTQSVEKGTGPKTTPKSKTAAERLSEMKNKYPIGYSRSNVNRKKT